MHEGQQHTELHNIALRLGEVLAPSDVRGLSLRQCVIQSVQHTSGTCTIRLGASTTDITGVKWLGPYMPSAGDVSWALVNGPDILIIGTQSDVGGSLIWGNEGTTSVTAVAGTTTSVLSTTILIPRAPMRVKIDAQFMIQLATNDEVACLTRLDGGAWLTWSEQFRVRSNAAMDVIVPTTGYYDVATVGSHTIDVGCALTAAANRTLWRPRISIVGGQAGA